NSWVSIVTARASAVMRGRACASIRVMSPISHSAISAAKTRLSRRRKGVWRHMNLASSKDLRARWREPTRSYAQRIRNSSRMPQKCCSCGGSDVAACCAKPAFLRLSGEAMRFVLAAGAATGLMCASAAALAAGGGAPQPVVELPTLDIFSTTPLSGTGVDVTKVPAAVTKVDAKEIERQHAPTAVNALDRQTPSLQLQTITGNDLQPDVYFRGFDASPVQGTPQGLAVYQNGMRINEAFGDTVNWDLIPPEAVKSMEVISNNPAFGLNALGGAISMTMKDGFNFHGTTLDLMGGSFGRAQASLQYGKQVGPWAAYIAIDGVHDDGYRHFGRSDLRRIYGDIGYKGDQSEFHITAGG